MVDAIDDIELETEGGGGSRIAAGAAATEPIRTRIASIEFDGESGVSSIVAATKEDLEVDTRIIGLTEQSPGIFIRPRGAGCNPGIKLSATEPNSEQLKRL